MMIQVEKMLDQEATESTAVVSSLLSKMKQMKQKLNLDLQREKHTVEVQGAELHQERRQREDLGKDLKVLNEELAKLQEQV